MSFVSRPRRIPMLGGRVQLSRGFADLVNLSRTGALIRTNYSIQSGAEYALTLKLAGKSITVTGRVVRSQPIDVGLPGGAALRHQFAVAFNFIRISAESAESLSAICGDEMESGN